MDTRQLFRAFLRATCLCALLLAGAAEPRSGNTSKVLPDLFTHLRHAVESLNSGQWAAARAHSDAVLLEEPIRIFVRHESNDPEIRARCHAAAERTLSEWARALEDDIVFETSEEAQADIVLTFQERRVDRGPGGAGRARWQRTVTVFPDGEAHCRLQANVEVRVLNFRGKLLSEENIAHIAMHEVGHVMGLKESSRVGDLMGPIDLRRPILCPTEGEIEALSEVRSEARQIKARSEWAAWLGL